LSIAAYLSLGIGGLMFVAVASVLAITLYANWRNTTELLRDKSRLLLGSLIEGTESYLDPAAAQAEFVAALIERGELNPDQKDDLLGTLRSALAATPQVQGLAYLARDGWEAIAARHEDRIQLTVESWIDEPRAVELMKRAEGRRSAEAYWGAPVYVEPIGTVLNLRRPVFHDHGFLGIVVAAIRVAELSAFVADLETELGQNAFILYDRDYVLAHRALEFDFPGLSAERPLPKVTEIGDPVLFDIWRDGWRERELVAGSGHWDEVAGRDYVYLYAPLTDYADAPWLVGSYFAEADVAGPFVRLAQAAVAGLFGLVLAVVSAFLFGRVLRRPVNRLGAAASAVRTLDLERVPALHPSWFRELDDAARAFNGMVAALRAFALYVPRRLVTTLIARGEVAALPSESREVTVLFTDIVGFTARTEQLGAQATAAFLNHHFALVTACIEAEGGTIDKYIGDAVMALWGAVEPQPDHALRAVRSAGAIAAALRQDNARSGQAVRLRIGVHTGPVVVGNIGTPTRMNYTVVGDTVNVAQRLEALGKALLPDADVAILVSASTAAALPADVELRSLGDHRLRGMAGTIEIFGPAASSCRAHREGASLAPSRLDPDPLQGENMPSTDRVLAFWFSDDIKPHWFAPTSAFDQVIRKRFADLFARAATGELAAWKASPDGCVALCVLLDQVPRNMFRGTPRAFATDLEARAIAEHAVAKGFDRDLPPDQKQFLYMPFSHSERLADQSRAVKLFESAGLDNALVYVQGHLAIIRRFGRFPHRNAILGRSSTPEELEFLAQHSEDYGQSTGRAALTDDNRGAGA
jgi:adenylate cyclase